MNNSQREPFQSNFGGGGMSPHDRIEDFKRRFHEGRHDPRMFGMHSVGSTHERMSPFFERTFGNRNTPSPNSAMNGERTVPLHQQYQQPTSQQMPPQQEPQNIPYSDEYFPSNMTGFMPFSARNPDFFDSFRRPEPFMGSAGRTAESTGDQKVHHIPIRVETRGNGNSNHCYEPNSRQQSQQHPTYATQSSNVGSEASQAVPPMYQQHYPQTNPKQHMASQSQQSQPQPQQSHQTSSPIASQCEIPIQVQREECSKQTKAAPNTLNSDQADVDSTSTTKMTEENAAPIPLPYTPLNAKLDATAEAAAATMKSSCNAKNAQTPLGCINQILDDSREYEERVNAFNGTSTDKEYKYLDEMLTRCILKLDDIITDGNEELRKSRKAAVNEINRVAALLESKVTPKKTQTEDNNQPEETKEAICDQEEKKPENPEEVQVAEPTSDEKAEKKAEKTKKRFFFKKSSKKEDAAAAAIPDTNNNTLGGKETAV